ncbi:dihydrodipicolinate synthase family protein [Amycolatopsis sp. FDAARGOS 1241]|uniref:dihydrodipicolinate synthase family protein n=1 Tax=Amycolatopsis sp. FDAARGOS 1241 TaxID=2778070 RepID=UPI0019506788|nr:dihydrodipicolinate synthase family protein [Amycolatopsis sp. FDAARGOS 1241]QRP49359.1 dihydrodipicolinate synthase family protein [Amycolatopsis sp. FDAARGOS 1241]
MPDYTRADVKARAREQWRGACNVTLPSFTADFSSLNEEGIRHDVRHAAELGFWGTLIASECGTTDEEYLRFLEVALEAAPAGFRIVSHLSFDTTEQIVRVARRSYEMGAEAALLSYPPSFVPASPQEIADWTADVAQASDVALIMFAVMTWGFKRLDPSGFPKSALEQIVGLETAAALKFEIGGPATMTAFSDAMHSYGKRVLVENPMEQYLPVQFRDYGVRWIGTSAYESFGGRVPEIFRLLEAGEVDKALEVFWSYQSGREAKGAFHASFAGAGLIHRVGWKYLGWLNGFNGGLLRMPQMRLNPGQMKSLRAGLAGSGFDLPADDAAFYAGRVG